MEQWESETTGYTLTELLIVVGLILLLAFLVFIVVNPRAQLDKVYNVRRKQELAIMRRVFEDYYNDQSQYPQSADLCFDTPSEVDGICSCHVCGLASNSNPLASYMPNLFCDPAYPKHTYLYQYDCSTETPSWYRMCAKLDDSSPNVTNAGNYNYGISSENVGVEECSGIAAVENVNTGSGNSGGNGGNNNGGNGPGGNNPTPTPGGNSLPPFCPSDPGTKYCVKEGICNACGDLSNCRNEFSCDQPVQLYSDPSCSSVCE